MSSTSIRFLYVTTKDIEQARSIAKTLIEERLAACANILPRMESIYRWEGTIQEEVECVLILKTEAAKVADATKKIEELHSYQVPCVLSLTVESGASKYLDWLTTEVRTKSP